MFGTLVHLRDIQVKVIYEDHGVMVKVTAVKTPKTHVATFGYEAIIFIYFIIKSYTKYSIQKHIKPVYKYTNYTNYNRKLQELQITITAINLQLETL